MKTLKTIFLLLLMIALFSSSLIAQKETAKKNDVVATIDEHNEDKLESELAAYEKNTLPVLLHYRKKFETQISKTDKVRIMQLRTEIQAKAKAIEAFKNLHRRDMISAAGLSFEDRKIYMDLIKSWQTKKQAGKLLTKEYEKELSIFFSEIAEILTEWENDKVIIQQQFYPKRKTSSLDTLQQRMDFLFLNPEMKIRPYENKMNIIQSPYGHGNELLLELKESGDIVIELMDENGVFVQTLLSESRKNGNYKFRVSFNISEYRMFTYVVTMPDGEVLKKQFKVF